MLSDRDALLVIAGNIEGFYLSLAPEDERSLIVDVVKEEAKHLREIAARTSADQGPPPAFDNVEDMLSYLNDGDASAS